MKKLSLLFACFACFAGTLFAQPTGQTNALPPLPAVPTPSDAQQILDNLPSAAAFSNAVVEIKLGATINQSGAENLVSAQYDFAFNKLGAGTACFAGAEIQNAPSSSILDKAGIIAGVEKRWDTSELYALVEGRRAWGNNKSASWEALIGGGASYRPFENGTFQKLAVFLDGGLVVTGASRPPAELRAGCNYLF